MSKQNRTIESEAAHRLFEQQFFQPGALYGSRQDFFRDQRLDRYRTDVAFRTLVDNKLKYSMVNNPEFDTPQPPAPAASVIVTKDKDGKTHSEISSSPGFHKDSRSEAKGDSSSGFDDRGVRVTNTAGRVVASVKMDSGPKPSQRIQPLSTGVSVKAHPDRR